MLVHPMFLRIVVGGDRYERICNVNIAELFSVGLQRWKAASWVLV